MRRLLQFTFNIAVLLSALMGVAVTVLCVRSYGAVDFVERPIGGRRYLQIASGAGRVCLAEVVATGRPAFNGDDGGQIAAEFPDHPEFSAVEVIQDMDPRPHRRLHVQCRTVSWMTLLAGFAVLPLAKLGTTALIKRRPVRARGLCPTCDYDLRATPGRCPECGIVSRRSGM